MVSPVFQEVEVIYQAVGSLHDEWITFHEDPSASRFRSVTGAAVRFRPLWYCYQSSMAQYLTPEGPGSHFRGVLPRRVAVGDPPLSPSIPIDRAGICFDPDELGLPCPFMVEGGRLYALIGPLPRTVPEEGGASSGETSTD